MMKQVPNFRTLVVVLTLLVGCAPARFSELTGNTIQSVSDAGDAVSNDESASTEPGQSEVDEVEQPIAVEPPPSDPEPEPPVDLEPPVVVVPPVVVPPVDVPSVEEPVVVEPPVVNEPPVVEEPLEPVPVRPPGIIWVQIPDDLPEGSSATTIYQIIPGSSDITNVQCLINGQAVSCDPSGDTLVINDVTTGTHTVQIIVWDANDTQVSQTIDFEAFQRFKKFKKQIQIADSADEVDVLVVIDNSRSMRIEQESMAQKIDQFLTPLKGMDWRVGVTTTDPRYKFTDPDTGILIRGDGQLQKLSNGKYWIDGTQSLSSAKELFKSVIIRKEQRGWHKEQGIKMATRALQRAFVSAEYNYEVHRDFFRKKAALAVIVISDEDESYDDTNYPNSTPSKHGQQLVNYVERRFSKDKIFQFHSIITRPGDTNCKNNSLANQFGYIYAAFTQQTGGTVGSVCEQNYAEQLRLIGQDVSKPHLSHKLECAPMDINGDGRPDVKVKSSLTVPSFTLDGKLINFSSKLSPGDYSVEYFCPIE